MPSCLPSRSMLPDPTRREQIVQIQKKQRIEAYVLSHGTLKAVWSADQAHESSLIGPGRTFWRSPLNGIASANLTKTDDPPSQQTSCLNSPTAPMRRTVEPRGFLKCVKFSRLRAQGLQCPRSLTSTNFTGGRFRSILETTAQPPKKATQFTSSRSQTAFEVWSTLRTKGMSIKVSISNWVVGAVGKFYHATKWLISMDLS